MSQSISDFKMKQNNLFIPANGPSSGARKFKKKTNMRNSEYAKYLDS